MIKVMDKKTKAIPNIYIHMGGINKASPRNN
jgi:hypothetical protein